MLRVPGSRGVCCHRLQKMKKLEHVGRFAELFTIKANRLGNESLALDANMESIRYFLGERCICDECRSNPKIMKSIRDHQANVRADNQWLRSAGYGEM